MDFDATLKNTRHQLIHHSRVLCRYWERNELLKQMRKKKSLSKTLRLIALQECVWSKLVLQYNNLLASLQHHSKQGRERTLLPAYTQDMWWFYNLLKEEERGGEGGAGGRGVDLPEWILWKWACQVLKKASVECCMLHKDPSSHHSCICSSNSITQFYPSVSSSSSSWHTV
jgi:hypothetical protein